MRNMLIVMAMAVGGVIAAHAQTTPASQEAPAQTTNHSPGAKGTNGPVIVPLTKSGDTYTVPAGAKLNASQMSALKAGNLYVNVHTAANKGGEVRGQLTP